MVESNDLGRFVSQRGLTLELIHSCHLQPSDNQQPVRSVRAFYIL